MKAMLFTLSGTISGLLVGGALAALGAILDPTTRAAIGVVLLGILVGGATCELYVRSIRIPQLDRETGQMKLNLGSVGWPIVNGLAIGAGFISRISFMLWYLIPVLCLVVGKVWVGALIFGMYGFSRCVLVFAWFGYMNACDIGQGELHERLFARKPLGVRISATLLLGLGVAALFSTGL
ncbi:MAG: hypothetical protein JSS68_14115 [Actinobacteria bacterium]|nr:hypothetical protein [Actinomycetota bacterium]MBS1884336.1 hypothetical protein [Actinomycetota bacterium]